MVAGGYPQTVAMPGRNTWRLMKLEAQEMMEDVIAFLEKHQVEPLSKEAMISALASIRNAHDKIEELQMAVVALGRRIVELEK